MRTRIGTRLMLGAGLVTSLVIGVMASLVMRAHTEQLVFELTQSANQVSETIKSSTHYDMLENRRDDLHRQIRNIGDLKQQGIQKVRLFNKEGRIMFSSTREEIGTSLDKAEEACYMCHAEGRPLERLDIQKRSRIFKAADGSRVLGIINPIPNEASCWTADCHAHSQQQKILGVLDVNLSMVQADRQIARSRELLLICLSAWTMERFTSSTPRIFCCWLWAWQSAVQQDDSLGMGLMMPRMREPSGAR